MDHAFIMLAGIVLLAYTTQALAGFGSVIISITLAAHFYPIEFLLPVVVPLDILLNIYIISRHHRHIQTRLLIKTILPLMMLGLLIGIGLFQHIQGERLKMAFGIFVVLVSVAQLIAVGKRLEMKTGMPPWASGLLFFLGGIVQGIYASGGPIIVYAADRSNLAKAVFRSTLCALWIILNLVLVAAYVLTGKMSAETFKYHMLLLPVVIAALFLGERLHDTINEHQFKIFIYLILTMAGMSIIFG
jgi:uncharacterized membrane protein YfcA